MDRTDLFLFESAFARDTYQRIDRHPGGLVRCVFNGVTAANSSPSPPRTMPPTSSMSASSATSRAPTCWSTRWRGCAPRQAGDADARAATARKAQR